jgi:sporulation protein YlmC with PRC-barrel domain
MEENEHNNTALRLETLSNSDYEIVDNQPNISGWKIIDVMGNEIGKVEDLIFDREAKKVRYVVSRLKLDHAKDSRLVLIPIGIVSFHESEDELIIPEISFGYLNSLPVYEPGTVISPAEELAIRYAFLGDDGLVLASDDDQSSKADFYDHAHFNDDHYKRNNI